MIYEMLCEIHSHHPTVDLRLPLMPITLQDRDEHDPRKYVRETHTQWKPDHQMDKGDINNTVRCKNENFQTNVGSMNHNERGCIANDIRYIPTRRHLWFRFIHGQMFGSCCELGERRWCNHISGINKMGVYQTFLSSFSLSFACSADSWGALCAILVPSWTDSGSSGRDMAGSKIKLDEELHTGCEKG